MVCSFGIDARVEHFTLSCGSWCVGAITTSREAAKDAKGSGWGRYMGFASFA